MSVASFFLFLQRTQAMRPNLLERRRWAPVTRRPRFRPVVELLETRVVPSVLDYSAGFAGASNLTFNGSANVSGSVVQLTNGNLGQAASVFTNSTFDITQFTTTFTFQQSRVPGNSTFADGLTFTIQASPSGPAALGANGGELGYEGIPNSVAIKFDLYSNAGEGDNSTGIFTDGRDPTVRQSGLGSQFPDMSVSMDGSGVSLQNNDPMQVTLSYNGSTLTESVQDTVTGATFTQTYSVNIASIIGSNTAYLGFTGATGGLGTSVQNIQTWFGNFGAVTPPLTVSSVGTINGVEGQTLQNVPVATFTGPSSSAGTTAIINWGDGTASTGVIGGPDQNGVFTVTGTHTYAEEGTPEHGGPFVITVSVISGTTTASVTDNTNIADAPIVGSGGYTVFAVEGQTFTATVATFVDTGGPENASLDYSATINWGDGTVTTGTISGPDQNGVFYVSGTHAYAEESDTAHGGPPTISVTITHETAPPVTVFDTASVAEAPIVGSGGYTVFAVEGQTFTATVATFVDTGGPENASLDYSATIDWGDGMTTTGTISGPDQNGVFYVQGTHAYAEESDTAHGGLPTITVTITHESAPPVQVTDTAIVAEAPLVATPGAAISTSAGQDVTAAVATFVDTGGPENATLDYSASIDWGDGNTTTGAIIGPDQNGVFTVIGDHAYSSDGFYTINVTITHESAPPVTVSTSATVTDPGGAASLPSQGSSGLTELQGPPAQQVTAVPVLKEHMPDSTRSSTASNDLYWAQHSSSGGPLNDLSGWAADGLALGLQGSPS